MATRTVTVRSSRALGSALANAQPGDHIALATGNWTLSRDGTQQQPIVIKSATKFGATITVTITLAGMFRGVHGLRITGNNLGVQIGADSTFVRSAHRSPQSR